MNSNKNHRVWLPRFVQGCFVLLLALAGLALFDSRPAHAAGTVTDCSTYGPGTGTLQAALAGGGMVTFACDGAIVVPQISISADTEIDATGHTVTLSGNNANRVFYVHSNHHLTLKSITIANGQGPTGFTGCPDYCGGGVVVDVGGQLTVRGSIFRDNSSVSGGAISNHLGTLLVENSEFVGNTSTNQGGAILVTGTNVSSPSTTIVGTTFQNNRATSRRYGSGGAIYGFVGTMTISNSTFHGNEAYLEGGAMSSNRSLTVDSSTIVGNSAGNGGGIHSVGAGSRELKNTIVYGNTASTGPDISGPVTSNGHNLIGTTAGATITPQGTDIIGQDPLLGPLANNGGPTQTHALLPGSPALDAGDTTLTTDQRGEPRPFGLADDIGAYESQANGTIVIAKQTAPANQGDFDFTHDITTTTTFTLAGGQSETFLNVAPGTYTVTEAIEPAWRLVDLRCDDGNSPRPSSGSTITRTATIAVEPGETVTCTFTNSEDDIIIVQKRTLPAGGTGFDFTVGGALTGAFTLDDGQFEVLDVISGTYTITETDRSPAYTLDSIECTVFGPGPNDEATVNGNTTTGSVDLALTTGQAAFCLFTNQKAGSITIVKDADPADDTPFAFTSDKLGSFTLSDPTTNTKVFTDVLPGTYVFTETVTSGWKLLGVVCNVPNFFDGNTGRLEVYPNPGDDATCTFANAKVGSITIVKDADPADDTPFAFTSDKLGSFTLSDPTTNTKVFTDVLPGTYVFTETVTSGWEQVLACDGANWAGNDNTGRAELFLDAGDDATCTFSNTKLGTIIVVKRAVGGDATFPFTSTIPGNLNFDLTTVNGVTQTQFSNLPPGRYSISETVPADWTLLPVSCNGDDPGSIDLAAGETVVCVFINLKQDTIIVKKVSIGADGRFDFTTNIPGYASFALTTTNGAASTPLTNLTPATYNISEAAAPGWQLTGAACDNGDSPSAVSLAPDQTVTCTFTNTRQVATITIIKEAAPKSTQDFRFTAGPPTPLIGVGNEGGVLPSTFILDDAAPDDRDLYPKSRSFTLPGGVYTFAEQPPSNWYLSEPVRCTTGAGSSVSPVQKGVAVTLAGGDVTCVFTNTLSATIQTLKYNDANANGRRDAGERALAGWTITATPLAGGTPYTQTTNNLGRANFNFVPAGQYRVCEVMQGGWRNTQPVGVPCYTLTLSPGQTAAVNFGNTTRPAVSSAETPAMSNDDVTIVDGDPNAIDGYTIDLATWVDPVLLTPMPEAAEAPETPAEGDASPHRIFLPTVVR
jgi:predicted outer membrane repeat protein